MKVLRILVALLLTDVAVASDLIYEPINPAFGGNPLYGPYLLNNANAQNSFKDPDALDRLFEDDPLADFTETLNRQILSQIARQIVTDLFGEDGDLDAGGIYVTEDFTIEISTNDPDAILVNITDTTTGDQTYIEIPRF